MNLVCTLINIEININRIRSKIPEIHVKQSIYIY